MAWGKRPRARRSVTAYPAAPVAKPTTWAPTATGANPGPALPPTAAAPVAPRGFTGDEQFYFDAQGRRINDQWNLSRNQLDYQRGQYDLNRAQQQAELDRKLELIRRRIPGHFAARGVLNSGIAAQGYLDNAAGEAEAYNALRRQYEQAYGALDLQGTQLDYTKAAAEKDLQQQRDARLRTIRESL